MYFFFLRRQDFSSQLSSSTMDWYSHCKHELTFWIFHFQSARTSSSGLGITSGYGGMVGRPDTASMVEAKYPALRFKQQLTAYVEKIYGIIRDNLKKEISPFLTLCIQVQQISHFRDLAARQHSFLTVIDLHRLQELIAWDHLGVH